MSTPDMNGTGQPQYPPAEAGATQQAADGFFQWIRKQRVVRLENDRWIAGVASGIAQRFGIDPLIVRGVLFVSIFLGGIGLVAYALAWALLPEERDGRIHFEELTKGRFDPAIAGSGLMLLVGIIRPDNWGFAPWRWLNAIVWVGIIIVAIVFISKGINERRHSMPTSPQPPSPNGYQPPQPPPTTEFWAESTDHPASEPAPAPSTTETSKLGTTDNEETGKIDNPVSATDTAIPTVSLPVTDQETKVNNDSPSNTSSASQPPPMPPRGPQAPPPPKSTPPPFQASSRGGSGTPPPFVHTEPYAPIPVPPKYVVKGPGKNLSGVVIALCFFAVAGLFLADRLGYLPISLPSAILGSCVIILGLGLVVSGLMGRRSGVLGTLAIIAFLIGIPAATFQSSLPENFTAISNVDWKPSTADEASKGRATAVGNLTVDLTSMPSSVKNVTIPVESSVGNITIIVPSDLNVNVKARVPLGKINSNLDWVSTSEERNNRSERLYFTGDEASDNPHMTVDASLSVGNLTIKERS